MDGKTKFSRYRFLIDLGIKILSVMPLSVNKVLWEMVQHTRGYVGVYLRYVILNNLCEHLGNNVFIGRGVYILNPQKLIIYDNVSIHPMCYIDAYGGITIGNDVSIAHNCSLLSAEHTWEEKNLPIKYNEVKVKPLTICDDVWIGAGARILGGITINSRSIIAAGAVVTRDVEKKSIVGGIPAREIKKINI